MKFKREEEDNVFQIEFKPEENAI